MVTEAKKRANAKYNATHSKVFAIRLNIKTDADLIRKLDETSNKQGYIKKLIREDIERSQ